MVCLRGGGDAQNEVRMSTVGDVGTTIMIIHTMKIRDTTCSSVVITLAPTRPTAACTTSSSEKICHSLSREQATSERAREHSASPRCTSHTHNTGSSFDTNIVVQQSEERTRH